MLRFANGWLSERDLQPATGIHLFCLPHAGSGAAAFYRWRRLLAPTIQVCPVHLPGRELRLAEHPFRDASALLDSLSCATADIMTEPFAIFGHSMGALLAFDWTLRRQHAGLRPPECLFVSGRVAPHHAFAHSNFHHLPDADFIANLRATYGGLPENFLDDPELCSVFLPTLRADLTLAETYAPNSRKVECDLIAFAGDQDGSVPEAGLQAWSDSTTGSFQSVRTPGDHFSHFTTGQTAILSTITDRLARPSS